LLNTLKTRPRRRLLLWGAAAFLVALAAGPPLATLLLRWSWVRQTLVQRLEASFGRPVEVGSFSMSLLGGLRIEANFVTVAEDPRFGADYFLRAEQITASVRWLSLLRGRAEFGRLSIYRPSLNLVRNDAGEWNFLAWLPVPAPRGASLAPPGPPPAQPRLYRIDVDAGRVNFRQGPDQHPFALVEVSGVFTPAGAGAWQFDLEAQPMRAGTNTQEPGLLRARGRVGGAQSRLHPAELTLTWDDLSLSDALRLWRGRDFGVRGDLAAEVHARSAAPGQPWLFAGSARLGGAHRWDLPARPSDPAVNLRVQAAWNPRAARVELSSAALEAAGSNIRASGMLDWSGANREVSHLRVASSGISLADAFAWYRAFRPGVAAGVALEGNAALDAEWQGWPPRLEKLVMATDGARAQIPALSEPIAISRTAVRLARPGGRIELQPATITFAVPASTIPPRTGEALRFDAGVLPAAGWRLQWNLGGRTARADQLLATGAALGLYPFAEWATAGWQVQGAAELKLRGQGTLIPFAAPAEGTVLLRNGLLRAAFLADAVAAEEMHLDLESRGRRLRVTGARAFGARWSGTLHSPAPGQPWEVDLSTERIAAAEFDRWLGAGESPGVLVNTLGSAQAGAALTRVRARGRAGLSARLAWPLLGPLRGEEVTVDVLLSASSGRAPYRLSGTLAAPRVAPAEAATKR
jgi:hypothetical protein